MSRIILANLFAAVSAVGIAYGASLPVEVGANRFEPFFVKLGDNRVLITESGGTFDGYVCNASDPSGSNADKTGRVYWESASGGNRVVVVPPMSCSPFAAVTRLEARGNHEDSKAAWSGAVVIWRQPR